MPNLPKPLETYFSAANDQNRQLFLGCFADDAVVKDEGDGHRGLDEIAEWNATAIRKYNCSYEILDCQPTAEGADVVAKVSGTFPGSPIELTYRFVLQNSLIQQMEIK